MQPQQRHWPYSPPAIVQMQQKSVVAELLKRLVVMSVHVALEYMIFSVIGMPQADAPVCKTTSTDYTR